MKQTIKTLSLSGYKTYIIAGVTILYCLYGIYSHNMTVPAALGIIGTSGSIAALRLGVKKVEAILEVVLPLLQTSNQKLV